MPRLRRVAGLCSSNVSDTANMLRKIRKKKSSAVPLFRSGHMSAICARPSKGKGRFTRGWKPQVSTLLCARAASAQLPAEVQRKTSRPDRANTLTQFECPAQLVLRKEPPVRGEHADAVRMPRSAGAEKEPPEKGEPPARFRSPRSAGAEKRKEQTFNHLLSGNSILAELLLLCACSLRLLAALYARAFIMLTLAELGKRTRLGTRTLEATQCAVNRLIFLDADLRHSFPSLRTFPSWGSLSTVCIHPYTKP